MNPLGYFQSSAKRGLRGRDFLGKATFISRGLVAPISRNRLY